MANVSYLKGRFQRLYREVEELKAKLKEKQQKLAEVEQQLIEQGAEPKGFRIVEVEKRVYPSYQTIALFALQKYSPEVIAEIVNAAAKNGRKTPEQKKIIETLQAEWKKYNKPIKYKKLEKTQK